MRLKEKEKRRWNVCKTKYLKGEIFAGRKFRDFRKFFANSQLSFAKVKISEKHRYW